jgi:hypothetical protein
LKERIVTIHGLKEAIRQNMPDEGRDGVRGTGIPSERSILEAIDEAVRLGKALSHPLSQDERFKDLLESLHQRIKMTREEMVLAGMTKECADCAVTGEGPCCGTRTQYKYDRIILFINVLLGISLLREAALPGTCHFLTERGCMLAARHVICVNFICRRLHDRIEHRSLVRVQEAAGKELDMLFAVEEYLKKKIKRQGG